MWHAYFILAFHMIDTFSCDKCIFIFAFWLEDTLFFFFFNLFFVTGIFLKTAFHLTNNCFSNLFLHVKINCTNNDRRKFLPWARPSATDHFYKLWVCRTPFSTSPSLNFSILVWRKMEEAMVDSPYIRLPNLFYFITFIPKNPIISRTN